MKNTNATGWNPRYLEYAAAHQGTPEAQLAYDRKMYPGACMCGFILWVNKNARRGK